MGVVIKICTYIIYIVLHEAVMTHEVHFMWHKLYFTNISNSVRLFRVRIIYIVLHEAVMTHEVHFMWHKLYFTNISNSVRLFRVRIG